MVIIPFTETKNQSKKIKKIQKITENTKKLSELVLVPFSNTYWYINKFGIKLFILILILINAIYFPIYLPKW